MLRARTRIATKSHISILLLFLIFGLSLIFVAPIYVILVFPLRRFFVEVRTYENYANIPLCYSIDRFHNSQRGNPLDPQKTKGIIMSNFIKHNGSLINLNTIQEIKIHPFKENGKDKYSVVMVKLDNNLVSFGVFDDYDSAQNTFDHVAANIEYLEITNANGSANMFNL